MFPSFERETLKSLEWPGDDAKSKRHFGKRSIVYDCICIIRPHDHITAEPLMCAHTEYLC